MIFTMNTKNTEAFSNQVIQRGAVGDDVIELQARLQYNGYYHGKIDGVYGWGTYWSVRNFQHDFGLKEVDGLVGEETKNMLKRSTKYYRDFVMQQLKQGKDFSHYGGVPLDIQTGPSEAMRAKFRQQVEAKRKRAKAPKQTEQTDKQDPKPKKQQQDPQPKKQKQQPKKQQQQTANEKKSQPTAVNMPSGFSQNDLQLMANAVYGEARGEPYIGQVAVAAVILNRIESPSFPNTVSGVIFEPGAFTAVADGQIWLTPNETAKKAVLDAMNGWDPTENAMYYFNPNTATSAWIWTRPQIKQIGKHIFCE
ncbi:spore cortex-lytic enzyme [Bacillus sp. FJAT-47783]|uniref:spore cortex-lytic enzyme n=1 Tax=Bacillus sp. FJAT-47783 TaxID=2922712 RepID=UPI001FAC72CE|nr:spore cortex-lytic enzyme [Bacillus sp. FJAT-47783]